jgi:hypothetical protein
MCEIVKERDTTFFNPELPYFMPIFKYLDLKEHVQTPHKMAMCAHPTTFRLIKETFLSCIAT